MATNIRRVVTGHDENGKAVVKFDDRGVHSVVGRPGMTRQLIWTTNDLPVGFHDGSEDNGAREVPTEIKGGSVFRVVEYEPGAAPRNHRTDSIDYGIVMSGEMEMELDDGLIVHLKAGDVVVQRATIHNWNNTGTEPCVMAFILIGSTDDGAVG